MSFFGRLANIARGQVSVLRKRWSEGDPPVPDEVEALRASAEDPDGAAASTTAGPRSEAPSVPPDPPSEAPDPRDLDRAPRKKRL